MKADKTNYRLVIDDKRIIVTWSPLPPDSLLANGDKFEIKFNYSDISADTVLAMMRDMQVPERLANAVMARVCANPE